MPQGNGFGFGLGKIQDLTEVLEKARDFQKKAKQVQEELDEIEVVGKSARNAVRVTLSGHQEPREIKISPFATEHPNLCKWVKDAMNDAYEKSVKIMQEKTERLMQEFS